MSTPQTEGRPMLPGRLDRFETLIAATAAVIGLCGLLFAGHGFYIKAKAQLAQVLLARSFAAELAGEGPSRPWPWADFTTAARISAPRIGHSAIVLAGANGETLAFGPAWLATTPQPGDEGTAVIAAHRDTHFSWLKDVRPGDRIEVERADGRTMSFVAGQGRVSRWDENDIDIAAHGKHLALATCWPFDSTERGPLRYILDARLLEPEQAAAELPAS